MRNLIFYTKIIASWFILMVLADQLFLLIGMPGHPLLVVVWFLLCMVATRYFFKTREERL